MIDHARALLRLCAIAVTTVVLYGLWVLMLPFALVSRRFFARLHFGLMRAWARGVAFCMGMHVHVEGNAPEPPFLLVANHLSYVDIVVLHGYARGVFLAKSEIARWPVLGFLARSAGTLFVDRTRRMDLPRVLAAVESTLSHGSGVMLFPEGTSTDGSSVQPFKPSLFEVAVRARLPVYCASLGYRVAEGLPPAHLSVCWWGDMTFFGHLYSLLKLPSIEARVAFSDVPIVTTAGRDRKDLASRARRQVESRFQPVVSPTS